MAGTRPVGGARPGQSDPDLERVRRPDLIEAESRQQADDAMRDSPGSLGQTHVGGRLRIYRHVEPPANSDERAPLAEPAQILRVDMGGVQVLGPQDALAFRQGQYLVLLVWHSATPITSTLRLCTTVHTYWYMCALLHSRVIAVNRVSPGKHFPHGPFPYLSPARPQGSEPLAELVSKPLVLSHLEPQFPSRTAGMDPSGEFVVPPQCSPSQSDG